MLKGNKGEWSELYVFLKLISEGKLYAANADLEKVCDIYYPIIKILRLEQDRKIDYIYDKQWIIIEDVANHHTIRVSVSDFKKYSLLLLKEIKKAKGRSFSVKSLEAFLNSIKCSTLKAKSLDKSDIYIKVHDYNTGMRPVLGFSIKSKLGGAATLLNAGKSTNFMYKIEGNISDKEVEEINKISGRSKIRDRIEALMDKKYNLTFVKVFSDIFELNLQVIDSKLPEIMAHLLLYYYKGISTTLSKLIEEITRENPLNYNNDLGHNFYEYKVKNLIKDIALGMTPSKKWNGEIDATGGYIVVREDGEVLCYHIYNYNEFQDYLLNNLKFETPSSKRHDFGYIYKYDNAYYLNLNLQLRFI